MSAHLMVKGARGFDCNTPLTKEAASAFQSHGYQFVARYLPRVKVSAVDLSPAELYRIRQVGLGVVLVQHVESDKKPWIPSTDKGIHYGGVAASRALLLDVAPGTSVFLDMENVDLTVPVSIVTAYCNVWYDIVADAGYLPGIYVGWHAGLNAKQLYSGLKFTRYWGAYNLDRDKEPAVRGLCMKQHEATTQDYPPGLRHQVPIDVNVVTGDNLGGFPTMDMPHPLQFALPLPPAQV